MSHLRKNPVKIARANELRQQATHEERLLAQRLRTNQLGGYHFYRQKVLDGFILDFYCPAARLALEIDGKVHEHQRAYDVERDAILAGRGLRIMHITNDEVDDNMPGVLQCILEACQSATVFPPGPTLSAAT